MQFVLSLIMLVTVTFVPTFAKADDLLSVYQLALINDQQYASSRAAHSAGKEKQVQGRAALLPMVQANGNYLRQTNSGAISSQRSYTIALTQPLLRPANWEQYQQGKLASASSELQFEEAQSDLIIRVAQSYFDILAAQDNLAYTQANKAAIAAQLESARRHFSAGTATITDSHEAQARFDLAVANELSAKNELEIRHTTLQQITGKPVHQIMPLRQGTRLTMAEPTQLAYWIAQAEQKNPNIAAHTLALDIAMREIRKSRADHLPAIDLVANRSYDRQQTAAGIGPHSHAIGIQWSIPIFAGFSTDSRVREVIALAEKSRTDLEQIRRNTVQHTHQLFLGLQSSLTQINALEAAELSSQTSLTSTQTAYQVGVRINIDVLNAQQQLYATRRDLARVRYESLLQGLRLKAVAGVLNEKDLLEINNYLLH